MGSKAEATAMLKVLATGIAADVGFHNLELGFLLQSALKTKSLQVLTTIPLSSESTWAEEAGVDDPIKSERYSAECVTVAVLTGRHARATSRIDLTRYC